jgi:hypothetical protein
MIEISASRIADVGGVEVRRALPRRTRRTVGAWCFADHMGPLRAGDPAAPGDGGVGSVGLQVGPHPHMGLQTVTWLIAGELLHRDSLGSEQEIRAGQLNLMTAGNGVSHAEESTGRRQPQMHGIQLWVAQPETTRHGSPAFEHHAQLPRLDIGTATATVLVGDFAGALSPARRDTRHAGVELALRAGRAQLPLNPAYEYAIVVLEGAIGLPADGKDERVVPGELAYLGLGRDELAADTADGARLLLIGGEPFESPLLMWWNFVGRTREEMDKARADWEAGAERFGQTGSRLPRIGAPPTPWRASAPG